MGQYTIQAPDGHTYDIEGPNDASDEDIFNAVLAQYPDAGHTQATTEVPDTLPRNIDPLTGKESVGEMVDKGMGRQGGQWGLDEQTLKELGYKGDEGFFGRPIALDLGARAFDALGIANDAVIDGLNAAAEMTGLEDALSVGGNKFRPGDALGALQEAFPLGGIETGITPIPQGRGPKNLADETPEVAPGRLSPELEQEWTTLLDQGSVRSILDFAEQHKDKMTVNTEEVVNYVYAREQGMAQDPAMVYADKSLNETALEQEAQSFKPKPEVDEETLWPSEETLKAREEALTAKLEQEAAAFQANKAAEETAAAKPVVDVNPIVDQINERTARWKNSPEIEVHESFDALDGVDNDALGVTTPEGKVLINGSKMDSPETIDAVLYHEALGHNGLTQRFRQFLDQNLERWYNNSTDFRQAVDDWMEENPEAYIDRPDRLVRAADEVLAEMSEGGPMTAGLMDRIKNQIKAFARRAGMKDVEFSDRELRTILAMSHDAVIKGHGGNVLANGFRFSMPKDKDLTDPDLGRDETFVNLNTGEDGPTVRTYTDAEAKQIIERRTGNRFAKDKDKKGRKFSLSPESMRTANDVDDLLDFAKKETEGYTKGPTSVLETQREADDLGLTSSKYLKDQSLEDQNISARIMGAKQVLTNTADELEGLAERARTEGLTPSLQASINQKLALFKAVYARFDGDSGELGRALRVLREATHSRKSADAAMRFMNEHGGDLAVASDPAALMRFLDNFQAVKKEQGPAAAAKFVKNSTKKTWEDYGDAVITNFMLSSPTTWYNNFVSTPLNFLNELAVKGTTSLGGQLLRGGKGDRLFGREFLANIYGPIAALKNWDTYGDTFQAVKTGQSKSGGLAGKVGSDRMVFNGPAAVVQSPHRLMAGMDEFWGKLFTASSIYGDAARTAAKEGLQGKPFMDRVQELVTNPTEEMKANSRNFTDRLLFRDEPTKFSKAIMEAQKPRIHDELQVNLIDDADNPGKKQFHSRTIRKADSQAERVGKFTFRQLVKFVPTLDSIARTVIRNTGPTALLSKEFRGDLMTPGVKRQSAMGRLAVGSAIVTYWFMEALDDKLTGAGDPDYKKAALEGAVKPPMSVKVGNEWMSYKGLDPISAQMSAAATMAERAKSGKLDPEMFAAMATGVATALKDSSYAEGILNTFKIGKEGFETLTQGKGLGPATVNIMAGQTANLLTPAFVRWMNQEFIDPAARDTTGDDSVTDRVAGRVKGSLPGLSDDLPQKYDVLGRPMQNTKQGKKVETDPIAIELNRLSRGADKVLVGPVGPRVKDRRLEAKEVQEYQRVAGGYLMESMKEIIDTPEWKEADDELKREVVKEIYNEAKKMAREDLFPEEVDEDAVDSE